MTSFQYEGMVFDWRKVVNTQVIPEHELQCLDHAELRARMDYEIGGMRLDLRTYVLTERLPAEHTETAVETVHLDKTVTKEFPATWWQHLKLSIADRLVWGWLWRRVRYKEHRFRVEQDVAVRLSVTVRPMVTWPDAQYRPERFGRPVRIIEFTKDTTQTRTPTHPWTTEE